MADLVGPIQFKRGTTAQWAAATVPLAEGEMGVDLTLMRVKIGDGSTLFPSLPWASNDQASILRLEAAADALDEGVSITDAAMTTVANDAESSFAQAQAAAIDAAIEAALTQGGSVGFDLIPVLGQSNGKGQATDYNTATIDVADPLIFTFPGRGSQAGTIVPATEPLEHVFVAATGMGIAMPFARRYLGSDYATGRPVLIVPVAVGGTGFTSNGSYAGRWQVDNVAGTTNLYETAIAQIEAALTAAGPSSRIAAILFHQEEADDNVGMSEATYAGYQDALIAGIRSRIPAAARAPFIIGQSSAERRAQRGASALGILAAKVNTPARVELSGFGPAPATGFTKPGDPTHYNAQGIRLQADSMFEAFGRALANRRGTQPVPPSAVYLDGTAVSWEPVVGRATSYTLQYQETEGGAWTTATTPHALALSATLPVAAYAARVATVNEIGTSGYRVSGADASATPPVVAYAYDDVTLDGLYGLSRLRTSHTGPIIRVRRSSDNTEQDCTTLTEAIAFCGSGDGYVKTWFDQSGNSRDFTQSDTSRQPIVVSAGAAVLATNGTPLVKCDGTDDGMIGSFSGAYAAGAASIAMVCEGFTGSASGSPIYGEYSNSSNAPVYEIAVSSGGSLTQLIRNDSNTVLLASSPVETPYPLEPGVPSQLMVVDDGTVFRKRSRATELTSLNASSSPAYVRSGTVTTVQSSIGGRYRNAAWSGHRAVGYAEIVVRRAAWTAPQIAQIEGILRRLNVA